jgi:hypothetical protein
MRNILASLTALILLCGSVSAQQTLPGPGPVPTSASTSITPFGSVNPVQLGKGFSNFAAQINARPPTINDDSTRNNSVGDIWCVPALNNCWQNISNAAGAAAWLTIYLANNNTIGNVLPLDASGVTAQFALGTALMTKNANVIALNKSIDVWRSVDQTTLTVGWANGYVDAQAADNFCNGSLWCDVSKAYDQSYVFSTGALNSNDHTSFPGNYLVAASVATGGTCTPGTYTFTLAGGTGSPLGQFSGTVTGTALAGALTVSPTVPGAYLTPPASPTSTTGGTCTVQPTITATFQHSAPLWTTNTVNGHRVVDFGTDFTSGNPQTYLANEQWLNSPAGVAINLRTATIIAALQNRTAIYGKNVIYSIGPPTNDSTLQSVCATGAGISVGNTCNTSAVGLTNPAIWQFQTGAAATTYNIGNVSGSVTVTQPNAVVNGGSIGPGLVGRVGDFDLLGMIAWNSTLSAAIAENVRASFNLLAGNAPQASDTRIIFIGDSIAYGFTSPYNNGWPKFMQMKGLMNRPVQFLNMGYPGGQFVGGTRNFTTSFSADSTAAYAAGIPHIFVPIALGRNDLANGASAATTFASNQTYSGDWQALGSNVQTVAVTLIPETDVSIPAVATYNALVRLCWQVPIAATTTACPTGGLGAVALIDFANDPIWSSGSFTTYLVANGPHPTDPGAEDMAITAATQMNALINQ